MLGITRESHVSCQGIPFILGFAGTVLAPRDNPVSVAACGLLFPFILNRSGDDGRSTSHHIFVRWPIGLSDDGGGCIRTTDEYSGKSD